MPICVPAEWSPHRAMWLGFPSHANLWCENLRPAQQEVAALARTLAKQGNEHVRLFCGSSTSLQHARRMMSDVLADDSAPKLLPGQVSCVRGQFGDIWLRDTGPIFASAAGQLSAVGFWFNGWGKKYMLEHDTTVAGQLAEHAGVPLVQQEFVLEGGSLDHDGEGTVLTTRQCLLNPNRNPNWTEEVAARALAHAIGAKKVLWLEDGLLNDHTDGHVDNLARFVAPGVVVCPEAFGSDDPNREVYDRAARDLSAMTDARGRALTVVRVPSPGLVREEQGPQAVPASHMNFLIANDLVIVPTYEAEPGRLAVEVLRKLFTSREVIGMPSRALLSGGGSFHCITQQEPAL